MPSRFKDIFCFNRKVRIDLHFTAEFYLRNLLCTAGISILVFVTGCGSADSGKIEPQTEEIRLEEKERIRNPIVIELAGTEHSWRAEYLSPNATSCITAVELRESDIHVPVGADIVFILKSNDYIYTLAIPAFGLKEMAVPDLEFRMELRPMQCGHYPLIGEEPCGAPGQKGPGQLIVESPTDYQIWLSLHQQNARVHTTQEGSNNDED